MVEGRNWWQVTSTACYPSYTPGSIVGQNFDRLFIDFSRVCDPKCFCGSLNVDCKHLKRPTCREMSVMAVGTGATSLTTYFKLFFRGNRLSGSVIDGHGVSGQPMFFLQLSVEQVQGWERRRRKEKSVV